MKNLFIAFFMCLGIVSMQAQIKTPAASPKSKVMQVVGLTDVTVEYSRPSMKDRTIFAADGLVPYGEVWRTGANAVTKISFSDEVMIDGKTLKAGDYAILSIPKADNWNVHFYNYESSNWSTYKEASPVAVVTSKSMKTPNKVEDFTISFKNMKNGNADMVLSWENTMVPVTIKTNVDETVMNSIESVMAGPSPNDYYAAASYYHTSGKDLNEALKMINKATDVAEPKFWQVRRKALILADLGRKKDAIEAAKMSKELALKADNKDYVRMNEKSIAEWSK